jgi:hypothetical protein
MRPRGVVREEPTAPFLRANWPIPALAVADRRQKHHMAQALMWAFGVIMRVVLREGMSQRALTTQDQPRQCFIVVVFFRSGTGSISWHFRMFPTVWSLMV